jgi:acyl-coenzyme A synthetase/AMP-(fatty) acid ligase/3-hydroxymyristoyl/3-hydroxydecanoyl-(acyl carrier protein) dehydratase
MSLPLHLLLASGRPGEHPVCHDGQRFVMWQEFTARVATHASHFSQCTERRWLLTDDDPLFFAIKLLALLHAGKQVVIPPNTQAGTLTQLAAAFDATAGDAPSGQAFQFAPIDPQSAIIDLYTSGSTGEPKRVRKTLAQFEAEIAALEALWGDTLGQSSIIASAPHQHIYGLLFRLLWPLSAGRPFDSVTCAHPDTLSERLALLQDTALVSSPAQLSRLPELVPLDSLNPAPTMIFSSGGPLPAGTASEFHRQLGQAPTEVFGSTETGGIAWRRQEGQPDSDAWTPLPGIGVDCNDEGALLLNSPFLTDAAPWRMDDAIEPLPGGRFRLRGRLDRIVKIEEKRLSLPAMEAQLLAHPWISAAAAVALPGHRQSVGAVVELTAEGKQQLKAQGKRDITQQLRRHLAAHFEAVLLPRRWRFPEHLPLNARGKLTQSTLEAMFVSAENQVAATLQPEVLAVRPAGSTADHVTLDLHVPRGLAHFPGHFPGLAILPGVVQIDWAVRFAREHLPLCGEFTALENIKFLALVLPDARLELTLKWDAEKTRLEFSFATSQRKYSSGRIVFSANAGIGTDTGKFA